MSASPVVGTASSFILAAPLALVLMWLQRHLFHPDITGLTYASLWGA